MCFAARGLKPRAATLTKRMTLMRHRYVSARVLAEHLREVIIPSVSKGLSRGLLRNKLKGKTSRYSGGEINYLEAKPRGIPPRR